MSASGDLERFIAEVAAKRDSGIVTSVSAARGPSTTEREAADCIAVAQGFAALGAGWRSVDSRTARQILVHVLGEDLAYGVAIMARKEAEALADRWLSLTSQPRAFFTNGTWADPPLHTAPGTTAGPSWDPITSSTFDAGVIAIDADRSVIFWVQVQDYDRAADDADRRYVSTPY